MDGPANEVAAALKDIRAAGKGVLGMKLYGCGTLVEPAQREESIKYVFKNDLVNAMTVAFSAARRLTII